MAHIALIALLRSLNLKQFKIGDRVKIAETSKYYTYSTPQNPRVCGKVTEYKPVGLPVRVRWDNGHTNVYQETDLALYKSVVKRHKPKPWVYKAYALSKGGHTSKEISEILHKPDRTVRHNLQVHAELLESTPIPEATATGFTQTVDVGGGLVKVVHTKKPTIFVIPDTQCKQGVPLDYLHWVGAYIARKKPDIIVHIGDHYDMASLSTYDKGKLSAEGRRVREDIDAGDKGIEILEHYINSVEGYKPRKVVTLGNHEDRIDRYVQENPELQGFMGTEFLAFAKHGWEVYPFLKPVNICGINFVHYLPNTMTGKPMGGTSLSRLKNVGESYVMGHVQTYDFCQRPLQLSGRKQIGLIVGACYQHDEGYKGYQGNHHFRGCVMMYECHDGYAMHKAITLDHLKESYDIGVCK